MGFRMMIARRKKFDGVRAVMIVQLVLVLLLPFLFTQMGGCEGQKDTLDMNLGAEVTPDELDAALTKPLSGTDPVSIKLGEAYVVSETQDLGGGAAFAVISDTAQTVVERQESSAEILLTVIEHKQKYVNGQVQKTSTEIPYRIEKGTAPAPAVNSISNTAPTATAEPHDANSKLRPEVETLLRERSPTALISALRSTLQTRKLASLSPRAEASAPVQTSAQNQDVTFHGLKVSVAKEPPPELVQKQENCGGVPNCKITVHRVSFDMVFWENGKPDRVHWDLVMSPEAPYLAAMLNKCVTGLAQLSGNQGDILVKQCLPVLNFRYGQ